MENLKIDDLLPDCEKCQGTGKLEHPDMKKQNQRFGSHLVYATPVDCDQCNGKGVIPTELGKTLLAFFQKAKRNHLI